MQIADARESIGGAASVAQTLPPALSGRLLDSARTAFDAGIAPTATIAAVLVLIAAAVVALRVPRSQRRRSPISISTEPSSGATVRTWFHAVHGPRYALPRPQRVRQRTDPTDPPRPVGCSAER